MLLEGMFYLLGGNFFVKFCRDLTDSCMQYGVDKGRAKPRVLKSVLETPNH